MDEAMTPLNPDPQAEAKPVPCRYCRQPVHPKATKCPHCHEQLATRSRIERIGKKTVAFIGIATASLSLFYALKEGFFYIEQRQEQRALFVSHMNAAEHFLKLDNLEHAEASLKQALELNPADTRLLLKYFLLRAHNLLRVMDFTDYDKHKDQFVVISELVTSGFSLLENDFPVRDHATLLVTLARLLKYDVKWENPDAIRELFVRAHKLSPDDAEITYRYGEWLMTEGATKKDGLSLIHQAVSQDPDDALYVETLGDWQREQGDYAAAFKNLRHAIELGPRQHEQYRIRASEYAAYDLSRALLSADQATDITGTEFFGLSLDERLSLMTFVLEHPGNNESSLRIPAARLFHHAGRDEQAEPLLRKELGDYDERSNSKNLTLFASVLEAESKNEEAKQVRDILAKQSERERERASYEEIFETGVEGQHLYKIGLKVAKQNSDEGVEVLEAFSGYPFAKAGVHEGDRLLEFAHRKVSDLSSITNPIIYFSPGTDVPLKIRRGDELLDLTIVIE